MKAQNLDRLQRLAAEGQDVPFLATIPSIIPGAEWLWKAWGSLNRTRSEKARPILLAELLAYVEYHGIDSWDDRQLLLRAITEMDKVHLSNVK